MLIKDYLNWRINKMETLEYKGYTIEIGLDEYAESPRVG